MVGRLLAAAALMAGISAAEPIDIWLDVDPAAGLPERDIDDCLAMIQAFHAPELNVRGVSVVYGNAPHKAGLEIAREVVSRFGPEGMQPLPGAITARKLGEESEAVRGMAAALRDKPMHILALGPMTNVATLLQRHPELAERIESFVVVAGRRPGQRFQSVPGNEAHFPDFNFELDPKGMQIVLDSGVPLVMAPWEVSSHIWFTRADYEALAATGAPGQWMRDNAQLWLDMWQEQLGVDGHNPFDTLAVLWMTDPDLIQHLRVDVSIEEREHDGVTPSGPNDRLETKPYLLVEPSESGEAIYCYEPKAGAKTRILSQMAGP